jgi:LacI family transcriptional regulator, galactose operon repressor
MAITIKDLAQMANTSTATVSRVLSNKAGVAESKRKRILELADRLGYSPNRLAQNLALKKSYVLGLIAADLRNEVYIDFFRRVQHFVEPLGYRVLICDSELDIEKEKHNIQIMQQHRAEGLLVFPVHDWHGESPLDHFLELKLKKYPFVLVGKVEGYGFDFVTSEEVEIAFDLTKHLLDLGHKRIAFVGADEANRCIRERMHGVRLAMRGAGLSLEGKDVIVFQEEEEWIQTLTRRLQEPDRPTALVMVNAVTTLMAYRHILDLGLKLPEDLSIVCFDDELWTRHLKPTITTTAENSRQVAQDSIQLLLDRMEDPDGVSVQKLVPQEFKLRESTAPPPVS